ncbi:branched-chain amino acid ABC transporter permease [Streptococcus sp. DD13]|uniref:branched-chain amino acid ABC transporter permease n=1 Tax=Streptococcus sp. DD13 TaxID=1777881 RepID=UPI000836A627|nr:branched-chain amino acid ABC transporter permease [Streptococcus sp. DD13]
MLHQLVNAIVTGSIFALLALGYTMVYGIIKLINFAHGDIFMLGAFIGYYLFSHMNLAPYLTFIPSEEWRFYITLVVVIVITMVITAMIGMIIEFLAYRPIRGASRISALITAIGVSFFLEYGMVFLVGAQPRSYPESALVIKPLQIGSWTFDFITNAEFIIFIVAIALMFILQFVVKRTKMGKAMRAVSVDSDAAQLMGINVNSTISFTFALGSALAGAAGVLIPLSQPSIEPLMGMVPGIKAFVAAVLGGIGIIPGAALGGFLIGGVETVTVALGFSNFRDAIVYIVLILILLVRPAGILGKNVKEKV